MISANWKTGEGYPVPGEATRQEWANAYWQHWHEASERTPTFCAKVRSKYEARPWCIILPMSGTPAPKQGERGLGPVDVVPFICNDDPLKLVISSREAVVRFDLSRALGPQMRAVEDALMDLTRDNKRDHWAGSDDLLKRRLRVFDARAEGASWADIGAIFFSSASEPKVQAQDEFKAALREFSRFVDVIHPVSIFYRDSAIPQ